MTMPSNTTTPLDNNASGCKVIYLRPNQSVPVVVRARTLLDAIWFKLDIRPEERALLSFLTACTFMTRKLSRIISVKEFIEGIKDEEKKIFIPGTCIGETKLLNTIMLFEAWRFIDVENVLYANGKVRSDPRKFSMNPKEILGQTNSKFTNYTQVGIK